MYSSSPNPASGQVGRKTARHKKNRRAVSTGKQARPWYTVPTIYGVGTGPGSGIGPGNVVTIVTDMEVSVMTKVGSPLPGYLDLSSSPALTVIAVAQVSPTEVAVTFSGTVQPGDTIFIPDLDPVVRTSTGGYVQPGNYTAP